MSSILSKRLARLEGTTDAEDLVVVIQRFSGTGEYVRVKGDHGLMIERRKGESEDELLQRANAEIVAAIKETHGPQPCYVLQPLRGGDRELETTPQIRPKLTRDEWLTAHGLRSISGETAD